MLTCTKINSADWNNVEYSNSIHVARESCAMNAAGPAASETAALDAALLAREHVEVTPDGPRLMGGRCTACGTVAFPPPPVCHNCWSTSIEPASVGTRGTLYSYSIVHIGPKPWRTPYALGYVDMPHDIRVLAHIQANDLKRIAIGSDVELGIGEVGVQEGEPVHTFVFNVVRAA